MQAVADRTFLPVKNLVVPRFLALMVITGLFDVYAVLFGLFGGISPSTTSSPRPCWQPIPK